MILRVEQMSMHRLLILIIRISRNTEKSSPKLNNWFAQMKPQKLSTMDIKTAVFLQHMGIPRSEATSMVI